MTLRRLKSPQYDVQAAKFASEAGVIIREKIPILTHWKDYKNNKVKYYDPFVGELSVSALLFACLNIAMLNLNAS
jgi:hypothetical protein